MNDGYIQLYRTFFHGPLWREDRVFSNAEAFLDLLQLAAHAHTQRIVKGSMLALSPSQLCGSQRYLAKRWGWSTKKVRHYLALLEADGSIEPQKNHEGTVITVCKYNRYICQPRDEDTKRNHPGTAEEPPGNRIRERKEPEERKETKKAAVAAVLPLPYPSDAFHLAWDDWLKFRAAKRKPVSPHAMRLTFADFVKWGEASSIDAIRHSIKCDYQGLYDPENRVPDFPNKKPAGKTRKESYNEQPRLLPD